MLDFIKSIGKNSDLEYLIKRLEGNLSNNYKDNARDDLIELENKYNELKSTGVLNNKKVEYYSKIIDEYKVKMKNYTHKDQKPYWT